MNPELPSDIGTIAALKREARRHKEELFAQGELFGHVKGNLEQFMSLSEMVAFVEELRRLFAETLKVACEQAATLSQRPPVRVLLTGGGAALPFVRDLASMSLPRLMSPIAEHPTPA